MAYTFGDGFDCYATMNDATAGFWDGGTGTGASNALTAGRFAGSQALSLQGAAGSPNLVKNSGSNDAVHHVVCGFRQTAAMSGTTIGAYLQFSDGATNQCCIVFRSDGTILLTSAIPTGTVLATWSGGVTGQNVWIAYEFEVVINNTTGSFTARRNGNTANDFTATSLNTRPGVNSYANKLSIGQNTGVLNQQFDDLLWRSDAASVAWIGDVRCYTRMPSADVQAQWSKSPAAASQSVGSAFTTTGMSAGTARYAAFTAAYDGTIGSASLSLAAGYTGNMKCSIFASSGSAPTTVLGSATTITNPVSGANTFTFATPVPVAKGTQYYIGADSDTGSPGTWNLASQSGNLGMTSATPYASFPAANPGAAAATIPFFTLTITVGSNATLVNETTQDGATSYVFDSNVGDADLYAIAALSGTPTSTIAVTTRGFAQKSDAGTRNAAVQLKSGATTVTSASTALSTSFGWLWRVDTVDPATGAAWTAAGVSNAQIGPVVTL